MGNESKWGNRGTLGCRVAVGRAVEKLFGVVENGILPQGLHSFRGRSFGNRRKSQETKWFWKEVSVESKSGLDWRIFWMLSTA